MGLGYHFVEALVREHRYRPLGGDVVLVGRQTVYFTPAEILALLRDHGIEPGVPEREIEIDRQTVNRRLALAHDVQNLITDSSLFRLLGVPKVLALDHSDYEGAEIIHDLNKPVPTDLRGCADFIVDGSTLDNVFDPAMVIRNFADMLRPGGRLLTMNAFSNHHAPYAIMPPLWFLDFFVINAFVDCKVYIIVFPELNPDGSPKAGQIANVFTINFDWLLDPTRQVAAFESPRIMATLVLAEKGSHSTAHIVPTQQHYRSADEWNRYRSNLQIIVQSSRIHLARTKGEISYLDVRGGHLFIGPDFSTRDPGTEIQRQSSSTKAPSPAEVADLSHVEMLSRWGAFARIKDRFRRLIEKLAAVQSRVLIERIDRVVQGIDNQSRMLNEQLDGILRGIDKQSCMLSEHFSKIGQAAGTSQQGQLGALSSLGSRHDHGPSGGGCNSASRNRVSPPDYRHGVLEPAEFRDLLLSNGAVMLRGAADPRLLDEIQQKLDRLFLDYANVPAQEFERHLKSEDPLEREFWEQIKLSHIYDRTFRRLAGLSYFDVVRSNGLWDLAARAFPESTPVESMVCNCRRMTAHGQLNVVDKPLDFHVDAQFFTPDRLSINFWTPLTSCGKDAPGIKVILLGVRETKDYLAFNEAGYDEKPTDISHMSKFRCEKMQRSSLRGHDILKFAWVPDFEKGDILALTNFTMHGTHYVPEMQKPRTSVEVRVDLPGALTEPSAEIIQPSP
jgi:hypothetical protein